MSSHAWTQTPVVTEPSPQLRLSEDLLKVLYLHYKYAQGTYPENNGVRLSQKLKLKVLSHGKKQEDH